MKKIAIIGAASGQKRLYSKAKELGLHVTGFAWDIGVLTDDLYDEFHEVSVTDTDTITEICKREKVDGVITTASDFLIPFASEVAERLGLNCTPSSVIKKIQDKEYVREVTNDIEGLTTPKFLLNPDLSSVTFPCVVKPVKGEGKKGVIFCKDKGEFADAMDYASRINDNILVEEYVPGREFSVESLSYHGKHHVVQITDKITSGPPHFVELTHHEPSSIEDADKRLIKSCICKILDKVKFQNGATHIEMKLDEATGRLYLIEINCRGGGEHICDYLVDLSTDCDYQAEMIDISLDRYQPREYHDRSYSGIYYLTAHTRSILKYFEPPYPEWMVCLERLNENLTESVSNYDRDGYFIYNYHSPIIL